MFEIITDALIDLRNALTWAPDNAVGIVILALAGIIALSIHRMMMRTLGRYLRDRHPYLRSFLARTGGLTQFAVLTVALFIALPTTPFDSATTFALAKILL